MNNFSIKLLALFLLTLAPFRAGLANEGNGISLHFLPSFEGVRLIPDSVRYELSKDQKFSVERLAMLVSGFALQKTDGSWFSYPETTVGYLELSPPRLSLKLPAAPQANYLGIRFDVGLPKKLNHSDPAKYSGDHPLNANLNSLHWTWAEGYIFLAVEGKFSHSEKGSQLGGYALHLGNDWARTTISLPVEITNQSTLAIPINLEKLYRFPEPIDFVKNGNTTHSRSIEDDLARRMKANLKGVFGIPKEIYKTASKQPEQARVKPLHLPENPKGYPFSLRRQFPRPALPGDNPLLISRVKLGRDLFFDTNLSADNSTSCSSCHDPALAFSDSRTRSLGINEQPGFRHSMPLFNLAWRRDFFWDGRAASLREQVLDPITDTKELGNKSVAELSERLAKVEKYRAGFKAAFGDAGINELTISLALENYLLSLTSQDSPFDRAIRGEAKLSAEAKRGFELFFTEYEPRTGKFGADCFHCHGGPFFTDNRFRNNGLSLKNNDLGRQRVTGKATDRGKFLVPTLRNIGLTAPYMHDGRFATLSDVIDHYRSGIQRGSTLDANLAKHPAPGIPISDKDKDALIAFLNSLSDPNFTKN